MASSVVTTRGRSPMHIALGCLEVTLKYTYERGKTIIYQRAVPAKLRDRYPGRMVEHDLKTNDLNAAAKAVELLNKRYDAEFNGLAMAPEATPQSLKAHAHAFLKARGLTHFVIHNSLQPEACVRT